MDKAQVSTITDDVAERVRAPMPRRQRKHYERMWSRYIRSNAYNKHRRYDWRAELLMELGRLIEEHYEAKVTTRFYALLDAALLACRGSQNTEALGRHWDDYFAAALARRPPRLGGISAR